MLTDVFTKVFTTTDDALKPPYFMRFFELYWGFEPLFPCFASVVKLRFYGIFLCLSEKKSCLQDSPPAAGRFRDTLPLRRSAILSEADLEWIFSHNYEGNESLRKHID